VRNAAAVLGAEVRNGNGYALVQEVRHRLDRARWRQEDAAAKRDDPAQFAVTGAALARKLLDARREHPEDSGSEGQP
jgi:hypothetical protein